MSLSILILFIITIIVIGLFHITLVSQSEKILKWIDKLNSSLIEIECSQRTIKDRLTNVQINIRDIKSTQIIPEFKEEEIENLKEVRDLIDDFIKNKPGFSSRLPLGLALNKLDDCLNALETQKK